MKLTREQRIFLEKIQHVVQNEYAPVLREILYTGEYNHEQAEWINTYGEIWRHDLQAWDNPPDLSNSRIT